MLSDSISLPIREKCYQLPQKRHMKITYNNARVLGSIQEFQMAVYYYFQELAIKYTSQKTTSKNFTNNEISFMVALRPQASNGWTAAVKTAVEFTNKYTKGKRVQGTGKLSKHASLTRKPAQNEKSTQRHSFQVFYVKQTHLTFLVFNVFLLLLLLLSRFSRVRLCTTPWTAAHQAPPSLGFSRQEHWSRLPVPSPMHESEK